MFTLSRDKSLPGIIVTSVCVLAATSTTSTAVSLTAESTLAFSGRHFPPTTPSLAVITTLALAVEFANETINLFMQPFSI